MLIGKFNKMIRKRWLWAIFAIIVSIIFIGAFTPGSKQQREAASRAGSVGMLFGEKVSRDEFQRARLFELQLDVNADLSPEQRRELRKSVWRRLAVLRRAGEMGLVVSDDEVRESLSQDKTFWENGTFSDEKFHRSLRYNSLLAKFQDPVRLYWEFLREEILIRKVIALLDSVNWVTPYEMQSRLRNVLDSFVVEYVKLEPEARDRKVEVSKQAMKEFFAIHRESFTVPEHISIKYVAFPISNYLDKVEVRDDEISEYYQSHLRDYVSVDTNTTNFALQTQALETVHADIEAALLHHGAAFEAKNLATEFMLSVAGSETPDLDRVAGARGMNVTTTRYFTAEDDLPGVDIEYAFYVLGRDFDPDDPSRNISDPLEGKDFVYVISTVGKQPAYIPTFESITDKVQPLAYSNAVDQAFEERASGLRDSIVDSLSEGITFSAAAAAQGLSVSTSEAFTVADGLSTNDPAYLESLFSNISLLATGEVTQVTRIPDGGALFALVSERTAPDAGSLQWYGARLGNMIGYHRIGLLYEAWSDHLLEEANFEDYSPLPDLEDEPESN